MDALRLSTNAVVSKRHIVAVAPSSVRLPTTCTRIGFRASHRTLRVILLGSVVREIAAP